MAQYGKAAYWDERYIKDVEPFDWYQRYFSICDKISKHVEKTDHILNVGCGTSRVTEEMYADGYLSIVNVDISKVAINQMRARHKDKASLVWEVMDAEKLDFSDETFDAVIEKGTLDAILCGENSTRSVHKILKEICRVLKTGKTFICISYGMPDNRLVYLEHEDLHWKVAIDTVPKPTLAGETAAASVSPDKDFGNVHFIYYCTKV